MKKLLLTAFFVVTFFAATTISAAAAVNDMVKVGLRYGDEALFSANLENAIGSGYSFGYFDEERSFQPLGTTQERMLSMTAAGTIYMGPDGTYSAEPMSDGDAVLGAWHVQLDGFETYEDAVAVAQQVSGYPAWINWAYVVRIGCFATEEEAVSYAEALGGGTVVQSSSTGVLVTVSKSTQVLFEFDCSGVLSFGVLPDGQGEEAVTWFKGYKYPGGFEYPRMTGGNLNVIDVVHMESYVKGVIPYEMNNQWPLAALEAQAVCARTYANRSRHLSTYGFDMCNTTDCQVYFGYSGTGNAPNANTNAAVENTAGLMIYHEGDVIQNAVYHSSNGGATEDVSNVWGSTRAYLVGKEDPYEALVTIPGYHWTVTYTADELTYILQQKQDVIGKDIGTVKNAYVSEYTPTGNVKKVTFEGSNGSATVTGETCRTIFYSSTYGKSVKSMRFSINGGGPNDAAVYVNDASTKLQQLSGVSVLSGSGTVTALEGETFAILSSSGVSTVNGSSTVKPTSVDGLFVIEGSGSGHNLGMSQYGAKAMAEAGYTYEEILKFYYTGITIQ